METIHPTTSVMDEWKTLRYDWMVRHSGFDGMRGVDRCEWRGLGRLA